MVERIIGPLVNKPISTMKILIEHFCLISKKPFYYFKEILNIGKVIFEYLVFPHSQRNKIIRIINGVKFFFNLDLDPQILVMFLGFYEIDLRNALITYLKKGGTFIDIGANIGFISAIGAGLVGKEGQVHSFEPVPAFYRYLSLLPKMNKKYKIFTNNFALGEKEGKAEIKITNLPNIGWNTMVPGLMSDPTVKKKITIEVKTLDDYILKNNLNNITIIKIDVEGFEYPVLRGMQSFFEQNRGRLPPLIIEVVYSAYSKLGFNITDLEKYMYKFSYKAYTLDGKKRVDIKTFKSTENVLFLPSNK